MKTLSIVVCIVLAILPGISHGQFQHSIGTEKYEAGNSIQPAILKKGYLIGGFTKYEIFGDYEATLVKTDLNGNLEWSAVYGGKDLDVFNSVREVPYTGSANLKQGYAALGTTRSFGFGGEDMYLVRTDLSGTPIFSRVYGRSGTDRGYSMKFIKDSSIGYGYVMAGETNSYPFFGGMDVYVVKADEFGNLIRATVIGGERDETAYRIEQTRDEGYIVVGTTTSRTCGASFPNQDIFVIRLDKNLLMVWNAIIGGGAASMYPDIAYGVVENPVDGSFTITGTTESFGVNNNGDAFLLNLKSNGAFNWMKTYGLKENEQGRSLYLTRNPFTGAVEYVVGGFSNSYNAAGTKDAYVFKTDASGTLLWTAIYGTDGREMVSEITDSRERGYVFTGEVEGPWTGWNDEIYHVKMDINGKTSTECQVYVDQKEIRNRVCYTSSAQQVFVDEYKPVETLYKPIEYKVRKCDPTAVGAASDESKNELIHLYPDAQTGVLTIKTESKDFQGSMVKIFNMRGDLVAEATMSTPSIDISMGNLPNGLYIVHIIQKDGTVTQEKFIR